MKKTKTNHLLEYLSPTLILSYFFIHNISLVLIGITLSLYLINIDFIDTSIRSINTKLAIKKVSINISKNYQPKESDSINVKSNKEDYKLTLVETIEELGFIPSINETDDSNAA